MSSPRNFKRTSTSSGRSHAGTSLCCIVQRGDCDPLVGLARLRLFVTVIPSVSGHVPAARSSGPSASFSEHLTDPADPGAWWDRGSHPISEISFVQDLVARVSHIG